MIRKILIRLAYALLWLAPIAALADYTVTTGAGSTVFSFVCSSTKICPAAVLINSANTEIMTSSNPGQVTGANGTFPATQSGTWTVQPGNTANTTPWLFQGNVSNAADGVATGAIQSPTLSYLMGFNGTTWDRLRDDAGKNLTTSLGTVATTLSGWTSGTALNATQTLMTTANGAPAILLQLNQTSTLTVGAVTIEGTYDGTNWVTVPVAQVLNTNTLASLTNPYTLVASTNQPFLILTQGYQGVRIKLSTQITGSATVTPFVTLLNYNPTVSALLNPLVAGSAIIGKVGIDQTTPNTTNHVSQNPYPDGATPYTASATGTTAATTATLAGASSVTTYLCGFSIRANATAAATGNATVTGTISATMNYTQWTAPNASGLGVTEQIFSPCVPASATNTSIAVISAAPGTGGVVSVTAWGYKL